MHVTANMFTAYSHCKVALHYTHFRTGIEMHAKLHNWGSLVLGSHSAVHCLPYCEWWKLGVGMAANNISH